MHFQHLSEAMRIMKGAKLGDHLCATPDYAFGPYEEGRFGWRLENKDRSPVSIAQRTRLERIICTEVFEAHNKTEANFVAACNSRGVSLDLAHARWFLLKELIEIEKRFLAKCKSRKVPVGEARERWSSVRSRLLRNR